MARIGRNVIEAYYQAILNGEHAHGTNESVALCTSTNDLASGRGDLYVALGLARALSEIGFGVRILPQDQWYAHADFANIVVAMLPTFDVRKIPDTSIAIAWVRNSTDQWVDVTSLSLFDAILASSEQSRAELQRYVELPVGLLPLAVDDALFHDRSQRNRQVVSTTVNHWGRDRDVHVALSRAPRNAHIDWFGVTRSKDRRVNRWNRGVLHFFRLPQVYRRSLLVIDDLNHTTKPFGNHNSRLFEAIASGALPLTNTRLGLRELGLDSVPVYRNPETLLGLLRELAADPSHVRELVEHLQSIVRARHTYAHRAKTFSAMLVEILSRKSRRKNVIGFFPDYRATNPYQTMVYSRARENSFVVVPIGDPISASIPRDAGQPLNQYVLHVHWSNVLLQSESDPVAAFRKFEAFQRTIYDLKQRGGRLLWTIHNALPHELTHYVLELELCRFLSAEADLVHVMGPIAFEATRDLYELPRERTFVVAHSSFEGIYADMLNKAAARDHLGIQPDEIVLLNMGGIRPYKGLDKLIRVFGGLSRADPRLRLLLSGNPGRTMNMEEFTREISANSRILAKLGFVEDQDLQVWLRAADVAVLPYAGVLNSSSLHLATTFGLPIVGPLLGEFRDLGERSFFSPFLPGDEEDMARAIRRAVDTMRTQEVADDCLAYAARYGPDEMSDDFFSALQRSTF